MQLIITILIPLLASFWVFIDAKDKGRSDGRALLWAFGTFMALIIFLPLWLFIRWQDEKAKKLQRCMSCQRTFRNVPKASYCPYCGHRLDNSEDARPIDIECHKDNEDIDRLNR